MTLFQSSEAFGLTAAQVRAALPYLSLPRDLASADLSDHGFSAYAPAPAPATTWCETAVEVAPIDGVQQWEVQPRPEPLADLKVERLAALADIRWRKAQTFVFEGVLTQASPAMGAVVERLALRARASVPASAKQTWKLADGVFRAWDEGEIEAFGFAIGDHIQACFDREGALTVAIASAETLEQLAALDIDAGWPA